MVGSLNIIDGPELTTGLAKSVTEFGSPHSNGEHKHSIEAPETIKKMKKNMVRKPI
jgi:hypothetical protein